MNIVFSALICLLFTNSCKNNASEVETGNFETEQTLASYNNNYAIDIITGAEQTALYFPLLKGKRVACVVNQSSVIGNTHLVDSLLNSGITLKKIFGPEHGFRGSEDAGAIISNEQDAKTGLPVISLYGSNKKPSPSDLENIDILIFDIQDIGARFYTYISTLHYLMEACAENNKQLIILDRPNPNGFYVDGPVLKKAFSSFVGMNPIPIVHGMTVGEYGQMLNGENWLTEGVQCNLTVIPCQNYDHKTFYKVTIATSPNLTNMEAIYLYPSLCFFEGTNVSVGRGTDKPFQIFGSPYFQNGDYIFTPTPSVGSKSPPFNNEKCKGYDLSELPQSSLQSGKIELSYLINAYSNYKSTAKPFFLANNFFNKLAGNDELMQQIKAGLTEEEIRITWQEDLSAFKTIRKKYLLYPDFE